MSNLIVDSIFTVTWGTPVRIRIGNGFVYAVSGPEEGLHYLTYRWPVRSGDHYDRARLSCVRALHKQASCQMARDAFVSAAIEAQALD